MTKTKITITGLALAITLLISAQAWADVVRFEFTTTSENYTDVAESLSLTATEKTDKSGVNFVFTSSWTGAKDGQGAPVNGGRGNIWNLSNSGNNPGYVYFVDHNMGRDVFQTGGKFDGFQVGANNPFSVFTGDFRELDQDRWGVEFSLLYANSQEGDWDGFVSALKREENPLFFRVYLNGLSVDGGAIMFDATPAAPEPATLAVLGLGLAGVGLASRRRRK